MSTYLDYGFNKYLERSTNPSSTPLEIDPLQFEQFTQDVPADKIFSGLLTSQDKKVIIDLENNVLRITDGTTDRITLGVLPDEKIGLLIKDKDNNILMQISEDVSYIQTPDGTMQLNFNDRRIIVKEESGLPRVILGKIE